MSTTLMERITGRRRAAEQKTLDTYRDLAVAVADGEDVDPARADAILLDAAKSPQQLAVDVETLRQRRVDVETAAKLPDLRARREGLSKMLVSSREALRRAEAEWREQTGKTNLALNELAGEIQACERAADRLRASRPDPRRGDLSAEKQRLMQTRGQLQNELVSLRRRLDELRQALNRGPEIIQETGAIEFHISGGVWDEALLRDNIALVEGRVRGEEAELAKIDARLAEVNATLAEIELRQLSAE